MNCSDNYYFDKFYAANSSIVNTGDFDLFYVDWKNPEADITDNAKILKEVIRYVNNKRPQNGMSERTVVVAHSMGGLITRCALREMELSGEYHYADHFISQDVPHLGAVMPIGAQYTLRDIYLYLWGLTAFPNVKKVVTKILNVLDCTSARQMMYNYVNQYGLIDNTTHQQFQSYLTSIGFPVGDPGHPIENLAIVSGNVLSPTEQASTIFTFGLSLTLFESLMMPIAFKNFSVWAMVNRDRQSGTLVSTTDIIYTDFSPILVPHVYPVLLSAHLSPSGIEHMDAEPGSYLHLSQPDNPIPNNPLLYLTVADKMQFVPAASAIAYQDYDAAHCDSLHKFVNHTPFDSYCFEKTIQAHDSWLYRYWGWVKQHCKMKANIPAFVQTGDIVSISDSPVNLSHKEWTSSQNAILSLQDSLITVNNPGVVTITFSSRDTGEVYKYYRKHRKVLAGFPPMVLSVTRQNAGQYLVSASCVAGVGEVQSMLNSLVSADTLKYYWGYKNANGSYNWSDSTHVSSYTVTVPLDATVHVCMKLKHRDGREGVPLVVDIKRSSTDRLFVDPQEIFVNNYGYSMNYMYVSGLAGYRYLAVWCNPDYDGTPITPDTVVIGSNTYSVVSSFGQTINGDYVTVYCFDIKNDPAIQQTMADIRNGSIPPGLHPGVSLTVKGSGTTLLNYMLPIVSRITGPVDPIH